MKRNPVDEYLGDGLEKNAERTQNDLAMWETWKGNPTKTALKPLIDRFEPNFKRGVRQWKAPNVNEVAFKGNMMQHAIHAIQSYDPTRGTTLDTHVNNAIRKSQRFNNQMQNLAYIPEGKSKYIGPINAAADHLRDEFGRDPTHDEIAKQVNLMPGYRLTGPRVAEIQGLQRKDILSSAFESDPQGHTGSRDREIVTLLRGNLQSDNEKSVYDYLYGANGKPKVTSTSAIANRMGMSDSQVSRIKGRILAEYNKYI